MSRNLSAAAIASFDSLVKHDYQAMGQLLKNRARQNRSKKDPRMVSAHGQRHGDTAYCANRRHSDEHRP